MKCKISVPKSTSIMLSSSRLNFKGYLSINVDDPDRNKVNQMFNTSSNSSSILVTSLPSLLKFLDLEHPVLCQIYEF